MVWQIGYSKPFLQGLHAHTLPSSYQQSRPASAHSEPKAGCSAEHAAGSAGSVQSLVVGSVIDHTPWLQVPMSRH